MSEAGWYGKHLTEDEIVADMLAKIKADPEALESWTNWKPAGLMIAGMKVRNYYGLWREDCPLTKADGSWLAPHPDDVSMRIINRVRKALAEA